MVRFLDGTYYSMEQILKKLVEIPSITGDRFHINAAIEFIDRYLSERSMFIRRFDFDGVEALVATSQRTKKPRVMLAGHIDVTPARDELFSLRRENGRYYGRGAADMKCAIAAYLQVVDDLIDVLHNYDFGIMITADEEIGGLNGTGKLLDTEYSTDVALLPDGGNSPDNWKLESSAKGKIALEIQTTGWSAHGSKPWLGENAVDKLIELLGEIKKLFGEQKPENSTISIGTFKGGEMHNVIPDKAVAHIDVRTANDEDNRRLYKEITRICDKYNASWHEIFPTLKALNPDMNSTYYKSFKTIFSQVVSNYKLVEQASSGNTDANHFARHDIPCIVFASPNDGYHAPDEWVAKDGIDQLHDIIRLYLDEHANQDNDPLRTELKQRQNIQSARVQKIRSRS